jgi:hypothetical protein
VKTILISWPILEKVKKMQQYKAGKYRIEIFKEENINAFSTDNVNRYDIDYIDKLDYQPSTVIGIKLYYDEKQLTSAVIGATGGATGIGGNSTIIEYDRFLICCSDSIFCISIPDLALLWRRQADEVTCFEIFKYQDTYIVHGELNISRLNKNGEVLWQQSGADIFTTLDGKDDFIVTENYILATDWENIKYKFDYDGNVVETTEKTKKHWWKLWK